MWWNRGRGLAVGVALLLTLMSPATATVTYEFTQTDFSTPPIAVRHPQLLISITFASEDAHIVATRVDGGDTTGSLEGLVDFVIVDSIGAALTRAYTEEDLLQLFNCRTQVGCPAPASLTFDLTPTSGYMYFNNAAENFEFRYGDGLLSDGEIASDNAATACFQQPNCHFSGTWYQVPEPSTLALLLAGAFGLAARTRRPRITAKST